MSIEEEKRLRKYLNKAISGPNTDAIVKSLALGLEHLVQSVESVNKQLYITTASSTFLDQRMADRDIVRPEFIGLSDEFFRQIGIEITNRKQVRDLINSILQIMYGPEFTQAYMKSSSLEPYALQDGDNLLLQFDDGEVVEIIFSSSQFVNIANATAQEVADAITVGIRNLGKTGTAIARDDGSGGLIFVFSDTIGPSSSVRIKGGKAQNKLKFPSLRPTLQALDTEWQITVTPSGSTKISWISGTNPFLGIVKKDDYVNIYGTNFDSANRGTFAVKKVSGGAIGSFQVTRITADTTANTTDGQYFDIDSYNRTGYRVYMDTTGADATVPSSNGRTLVRVNISAISTAAEVGDAVATELNALSDFSCPTTGTGVVDATDAFMGKPTDAVNGTLANAWSIAIQSAGVDSNSYIEINKHNTVTEKVTQSTTEAILFYNPVRNTIISQSNYATAYHTENKLLEVFIPVATRVVTRNRKEGAQLHDTGAANADELGPYLYDPQKAFTISSESCLSTVDINSATERIIQVDDSSEFPDDRGFLIFGYGTSNEEGPVPYIGRPSSTSLLIDPSYEFKKSHLTNTDISLVLENTTHVVDKTGEDYALYGTDTVSARIYSEDLIELVTAAGITLNIIVLYPSDEGLGKWGEETNSEKFYCWGKDPSTTLFEREQ